MIQLKNEKEVQKIKESGAILAALFEGLNDVIKPGISTLEVDKWCHNFIKAHGATAPCLGYYGYPNATCVSVNDTVIHGIPSKKIILKEGDLVSVDICCTLDGFVSDSTHTYEVGQVSPEVHQLNVVTRKALYNAIDAAGKKGARLHDIAAAVEATVNPYHYGIVREYCGHGVGFEMHEEPNIFNYVSRMHSNPRLKPGMVIAIEPMITMGSCKIHETDDEWTVKTDDGKCACHWEHTVAITEEGAVILT